MPNELLGIEDSQAIWIRKLVDDLFYEYHTRLAEDPARCHLACFEEDDAAALAVYVAGEVCEAVVESADSDATYIYNENWGDVDEDLKTLDPVELRNHLMQPNGEAHLHKGRSTAWICSEYALTTVLHRLFPSDSISSPSGNLLRGDSGRTWVINPCSGYDNFVIGSPRWATAASLIEGEPSIQSEPIATAISAPYVDEIWAFEGFRGSTSVFFGKGSKSFRPSRGFCRNDGEHSLGQSVVSTSFPSEDRCAWVRILDEARQVRISGCTVLDAVDFLQGRVHLLCDHKVPLWDWLPIKGLLREMELEGDVQVFENWHLAGSKRALEDALRIIRDSL